MSPENRLGPSATNTGAESNNKSGIAKPTNHPDGNANADTPHIPRRCPVKGCVWRGNQCPIHGVKHPRGFGKYAAMIRDRPNGTRRSR
jgi:hypothetical protein